MRAEELTKEELAQVKEEERRKIKETEQHTNGAGEEPVPAQEAPEEGSFKARILQKREELKKRKTIDLLVPGYGNVLAIRYHAIPGQDSEKIGAKLRGSGAMGVAADLCIRCCECMLAKDANGEFQPWKADKPEPGEEDEPLKLDYRLARELGYEGTGRAVVYGLFSPDRNQDLTVIDHANSLLSWMQGREESIDSALLDF